VVKQFLECVFRFHMREDCEGIIQKITSPGQCRNKFLRTPTCPTSAEMGQLETGS
jgi:hypothetical protein